MRCLVGRSGALGVVSQIMTEFKSEIVPSLVDCLVVWSPSGGCYVCCCCSNQSRAARGRRDLRLINPWHHLYHHHHNSVAQRPQFIHMRAIAIYHAQYCPLPSVARRLPHLHCNELPSTMNAPNDDNAKEFYRTLVTLCRIERPRPMLQQTPLP